MVSNDTHLHLSSSLLPSYSTPTRLNRIDNSLAGMFLSIFGRKCASNFRQECATSFRQTRHLMGKLLVLPVYREEKNGGCA